MNEKNLETMQSNTEVYGQIDSLEDFEKIESPDELSEFMRTNIRYGFVGANDGKLYSPEIEGWGEGEQPEHSLQSPEELLESRHGTCWDQAELERHWFEQKGIEHKTSIFMFKGKKPSQTHPAHSFIAFKKDGKWHWLENALDEKNKGIFDFDDLDSLNEHVGKIIKKNATDKGATAEDLNDFIFREYKKPKYGCDEEVFLNNIIENNKI